MSWEENSGESGSGGRDTLSPLVAPSPRKKEKKRVGFHAHSTSLGESASGASPVRIGHLDVYTPDNDALSPSGPASPRLPPGSVPPGAPDADELRRQLTKVISNGDIDRNRQLHIITGDQEYFPVSHSAEQPLIQVSQPPSEPESPRRPRPALRRNTSYDVPQEREEADRMEQRASPRQLQSMSKARQRANRLAVSLSTSHSAPGSRRNSTDMDAPFHSAVDDTRDADHDEEILERPTPTFDDTRGRMRNLTSIPAQPDSRSSSLRNRVFRRANNDDLVASRYTRAAKDLVDFHASKTKKEHYYNRRMRDVSRDGSPAFTSGASTPVTHERYVHDEDWVPQPERYRGGVLASLLRLYGNEKNGDSGRSTPNSAPGTPVMSPMNSPPASRSTSPVRKARRSPSSSFFSVKSFGTASTTSLGELVKSSGLIASPGSGKEISEKFVDRIKGHAPPRSKRSRAKITVHIADIMFRHRYLIKLCRALMMYGAPTHRLEEYMAMTARVLEIEGQFLYIPSCMIISFDDATTHTTEIKIVRVPHGIDFSRLSDVHDIYKRVIHDKLGVEDASRMLDEVLGRKPRYPVWARVIFYGIASCCVSPFAFQGNWWDMGPAFLLGCVLGILQLVLAPSNELYAHVFEVTAAIVTSFGARAFGSIRWSAGSQHDGEFMFCFGALAQSSIALILPGYLVLTGSLELQSQNIVAGSVRMVYAMIYTLFLGYGIMIGTTLYGMMDSNACSTTTCSNPLPDPWFFVFVPGFTMCLALVNQARIRQMPIMVIISLAAFVVNFYSKQFFAGKTQISTMLGGLTVGLLANLYSRIGRHLDIAYIKVLEFWLFAVRPRLARVTNGKAEAAEEFPAPDLDDPESRPGSPVDAPKKPARKVRRAGWSLAAAAMLPAIFVQVPSGLASSGSLITGIALADELNSKRPASGDVDTGTFTVLFNVVQVAIAITVGLFMSALIVYPLGKRRSGLFSF